VSTDVWAPPRTTQTAGWETAVPARGPSRLKQDVVRFVAVVAGMVLLGAPVGLLWSAVAPHYTVVFQGGEATYPFIESSKAFIGVEGSFVAVTLVVGALCGALAWRFGRGSGPWTVVALAVGGVLAALVASHVGLLPGRQEAFDALARKQGSVQLFLGARAGNDTHLRAPWAVVVWPVAALVAFLVPAFVRPEELD
jgi:MFS family permease